MVAAIGAVGSLALSALPSLLPYAPTALKLALGLLPPNASAVVQKGLDLLKKGLAPVQTVVDALKHVAGVTGADSAADISIDDMNRLLTAMDAAVDSFEGRANELRGQGA